MAAPIEPIVKRRGILIRDVSRVRVHTTTAAWQSSCSFLSARRPDRRRAFLFLAVGFPRICREGARSVGHGGSGSRPDAHEPQRVTWQRNDRQYSTILRKRRDQMASILGGRRDRARSLVNLSVIATIGLFADFCCAA